MRRSTSVENLILLRNIIYFITQPIFRFNDQQRDIATILLGMSNPMGIVMGQLFTPLIVQNESDVQCHIQYSCIGSFSFIQAIISSVSLVAYVVHFLVFVRAVNISDPPLTTATMVDLIRPSESV